MKPQRLLLISKQFWPLSGETELLAAAFARQLEGVVESVEVVTWRMIRQWPERFPLGNCDVVRLPQNQKSHWASANLGYYGRNRWHRSLQRWLGGQVNRFDAAIVFEHHEDILAPTLIACRAGLPVVSRILFNQAAGLSRLTARDWKGLERQSVSFVTPDHRLLMDPICAPDGSLHGTQLVSDGVTAVENVNDQATSRTILSSVHPIFQLSQDAMLAVSGCDLTYESNVFSLVRAWRRVAAEHKSARLWLIGSGRNAPELFQRICDLDLQHSVLLTGNFDNVEEVLVAADAYIMPGPAEPTSWYSEIAGQLGLTIIRHRNSATPSCTSQASHNMVFDDDSRTIDLVINRWAGAMASETRVTRQNAPREKFSPRLVSNMVADYLDLLQRQQISR